MNLQKAIKAVIQGFKLSRNQELANRLEAIRFAGNNSPAVAPQAPKR